MKNFLFLSIFILIIVSATLFVVWRMYRSKNAYIQTEKVYSEFLPAKIFENKLNKNVELQKSILDSLKLQIIKSEVIAHENSTNRQIYILSRNKYEELVQKFQNSNSEQKNFGDAQIWKQLNQYISDFGNENRYSIIFGANGNGTLMFGDTTLDITNEVIDFCNRKYKGK